MYNKLETCSKFVELRLSVSSPIL